MTSNVSMCTPTPSKDSPYMCSNTRHPNNIPPRRHLSRQEVNAIQRTQRNRQPRPLSSQHLHNTQSRGEKKAKQTFSNHV